MREGKEKILILVLSLVFIAVIILFFFLFAAQVTAFDFSKDSGLINTGSLAGYQTASSNSVESVIGKIISAALGLIGVVFLVLMIYGGFRWMTARDNEEQVNKAKSLITAAVIGLVITFAAYAISYFVINALSVGYQEKIDSGERLDNEEIDQLMDDVYNY